MVLRTPINDRGRGLCLLITFTCRTEEGARTDIAICSKVDHLARKPDAQLTRIWGQKCKVVVLNFQLLQPIEILVITRHGATKLVAADKQLLQSTHSNRHSVCR